jgi:hypothetical protein
LTASASFAPIPAEIHGAAAMPEATFQDLRVERAQSKQTIGWRPAR